MFTKENLTAIKIPVQFWRAELATPTVDVDTQGTARIARSLPGKPDIHSFFFFQAEDGIRYRDVTGVQTCALPIYSRRQHRNLLSGGWSLERSRTPSAARLSNLKPYVPRSHSTARRPISCDCARSARLRPIGHAGTDPVQLHLRQHRGDYRPLHRTDRTPPLRHL